VGVLQDRVMVITGSSRGLGLAIANAYAAEGAAVVLSSRSQEAVDRAVASLNVVAARAIGQACDVSDWTQVEALVSRAIQTFGRLDVWVNNAGVASPYGPTVEVPREDFVQTIDVNIRGTYNGSILAMRHFLTHGSGKLINILGRGDRGGPVPMQNGYTASKAWIRSFTATLAKEYRGSGVGVFAFNPGMMSTEFLTRVETIAGYESRLKVMPAIIRMWAHPPEIPARRLVWLASAATDGKTGLEIREMGTGKMMLGALREGLRRLTGRHDGDEKIDVISVPPAFEK
jgi:glucose 1-dehydrogenase